MSTSEVTTVNTQTSGQYVQKEKRTSETDQKISKTVRTSTTPAPVIPTAIRSSLRVVIMREQKDLHKKAESIPFVVKLMKGEFTKEEYMQYLVNQLHNIKLFEGLMAKHKDDELLSHFDFVTLYRAEALEEDIKSLKIPRPAVGSLLEKNKHREHFETLEKEGSYLLAAHAVVRYLAILFGGQKTAEKVKLMWDKAASTAYYTYPKSTLRAFMAQLKVFDGALTNEQFKRFVKELERSWYFEGDMAGADIRSK